MARPLQRVYSRYTLEALRLFAELIRFERKNLKMTESELAERAGISRSMLQRIEKADPKCEIGVVFKVAVLLGLPLKDNSSTHSFLNNLLRKCGPTIHLSLQCYLFSLISWWAQRTNLLHCTEQLRHGCSCSVQWSRAHSRYLTVYRSWRLPAQSPGDARL